MTFDDPHNRVNPRRRRRAPGFGYARADRATLPAMAEIEVRQADITKLEVDAISTRRIPTCGTAAAWPARSSAPAVGASRTRATRVAPIEIGEAVATGAGELPASWVIHAATMRLGGPTSAEAIRSATASTLRVADELGARSLGLVAFGTGVGGFSIEEAADIEVEEVRRHLEGDGCLERIVFCVFGEDAQRAFDRALSG